MKKVYKLKNRKRFVTILLLFIILILFSGTVTVTARYKSPEYRSVSVRPGDTLWEIAERYSINSDIREYIYNIKKINGLDSATIYPGQKLYIP